LLSLSLSLSLEEIIDLIVQEANRYAEQCIQCVILKTRSGDRNWKPVSHEVKYLTLGLPHKNHV